MRKYRVRSILTEYGMTFTAQKRFLLFFWINIAPIRYDKQLAYADINDAILEENRENYK